MVSYELLAADYGLVRVRALSDRTPPIDWRVVVDGDLVLSLTTADASLEFDVPAIAGSERGPFVEVLDHEDILPTPAGPDRQILHWTEIDGAASYRIDSFGIGWTVYQAVPLNPTRAYSVRSPSVGDGEAGLFRVVPIDAAGNAGTPSGSLVVVGRRHPDVPKPTIVYDGAVDGTVTITV